MSNLFRELVFNEAQHNSVWYVHFDRPSGFRDWVGTVNAPWLIKLKPTPEPPHHFPQGLPKP